MHKIIDNLIKIEQEIQLKISETEISIKKPQIIAVSKTFNISHILPLINHGHTHFGENKVQETVEKWQDIKSDFKNIKLHMIGKLQTNKVKHALPLFDYIHSLDSRKLAEKISNEQLKIKKKMKIFIQINIGNEEQKSGVEISNLKEFYYMCTNDLELNIIGLMCLPPKNDNTTTYFKKMKELSDEIMVNELSMGMSNDYINATKNGATFLRIGSKIFGERN